MFEKVQEKKVLLLLGIFVLALTTANLLGSKVTTLFGVSVSVGIFTFPFTFVVTDIVEEVYGKKVAKQFMQVGVIALIILFALTTLSVALPPAARMSEEAIAAYNLTFKNSLRFIIASVTAFAIAQTHDIWAYEFWRFKTNGRMLWLRNNLSTWVSQGIDTFIFMFIAFYGISEKFTTGFIVELALTYWGFKIIFAIIDTPLVYAGVQWLKKGSSQQG